VLPTGPGLLAAGAPLLAGGQNSIPSHVPLKSVLPTGPGLLAAGAAPLAGGQNSIPSHVPLKSVLARGVGFVVGALPGGAAGVGLAATVAGALRRTDEGGAATDEAGAPTDGADAAGAVELAAAGGGS
jgi:hypothetical protein